ncbi:unnamed protein product [Didymodactylos carnosus]|uniref:Uncharacterized protein n=1 Tax=Didymodactylos carnosus TaxID=1234261 RepID=A0A8S2F6C2_9BILA|nr:unnamed protein product [Didymodactylos carnosus]CAF4178159.1 unnamed protein product [Didymodactylos carnosus]
MYIPGRSCMGSGFISSDTDNVIQGKLLCMDRGLGKGISAARPIPSRSKLYVELSEENISSNESGFCVLN